jgi:hypothetical protein
MYFMTLKVMTCALFEAIWSKYFLIVSHNYAYFSTNLHNAPVVIPKSVHPTAHIYRIYSTVSAIL